MVFMLYSLRIFFITGFYKVDEYDGIDRATDQDVFNKKLFDKESNLEFQFFIDSWHGLASRKLK